MTIQTFPTEVKIAYPVRMRDNWRVLLSVSEGGVEQRISKWTRPIREIDLECSLLDRSTEADTLANFLRARKGMFESFLFILPYLRTFNGEWVATGNGTDRTWRLPFKNAAFYTAYINGVEQYQGPDYDLLFNAGVGGSDIIVFRVVPTAGQVVTIDAFDATYIPVVRLAEAYEDEYMYYNRFNSRVKLIEVKDEVSPY